MSHKVFFKSDPQESVLFNCPGCGCLHRVTTKQPSGVGPCWVFNGSLEKPTISPSILVTLDLFEHPKQTCHSFVVDGKIRFLSDCTHELAGQTVDLPDWDS